MSDTSGVHTLTVTGGERRSLRNEVWLMLGVSLGQSAVYATLNLINRLMQPGSLSKQSVALNSAASQSELLSAAYQIAGSVFTVLPALLALYLLSIRPALVRRQTIAGNSETTFHARAQTATGANQLGLFSARPWHDLSAGVLLTAAIGIPGLALYIFGRLSGVTVNVVASDLGGFWWSIPLLLISALANAVLEEVVVVGYLISRLRQLTMKPWVAIAISAILRGSYHLYQGFGPALGNAVMGVVFGWFYTRTNKVAPLIVAHFLLDAVAFVGYALAAPWLHHVLPGVF